MSVKTPYFALLLAATGVALFSGCDIEEAESTESGSTSGGGTGGVTSGEAPTSSGTSVGVTAASETETQGGESEGSEGTTGPAPTGSESGGGEASSGSSGRCAGAGCCGEGHEWVDDVCVDIDECATGELVCDGEFANGCVNTEGSAECSCLDKFEWDGKACAGAVGYQGACDEYGGPECASGLCVGSGGNEFCTEFCDQAVSNACVEVGAAGICVLIETANVSICVGDLDTGDDGEDADLPLGPPPVAAMAEPGDSDLFRYGGPEGGIEFIVAPALGLDIAVDVYGSNGEFLATVDQTSSKTFGTEFVEVSHGDETFAVVRSVSGSGAYTIFVNED